MSGEPPARTPPPGPNCRITEPVIRRIAETAIYRIAQPPEPPPSRTAELPNRRAGDSPKPPATPPGPPPIAGVPPDGVLQHPAPISGGTRPATRPAIYAGSAAPSKPPHSLRTQYILPPGGGDPQTCISSDPPPPEGPEGPEQSSDAQLMMKDDERRSEPVDAWAVASASNGADLLRHQSLLLPQAMAGPLIDFMAEGVFLFEDWIGQ
ncbi:hypothetical protein GGX14DRAFT_570777 [Mycena pura]|uniref:Uncharacterized protein n=1 Tax=Mycena pura TaxID=153505 RepID=A0AAD6Y5B8_9AGAR|nr:hypothetical protein GGX14DRAFT_570777 [Mycena pura]